MSLLLQRNLAVRGFFWEQIETGSRVRFPFRAGVSGAAISQPCCCTCPCSSFTIPGGRGAPGHLTTGAAGNVPMLQASKAMIRMQPCLFGQEGPMDDQSGHPQALVPSGPCPPHLRACRQAPDHIHISRSFDYCSLLS